MGRSERWKLGVALGVTLVFWASAFAAIRSAVREFSPGHLALLRFLTASTVLLVCGAVTRVRLPRVKDLPAFGVCGLLGIAAYHTLLNYGEQTVSAGAACLLINTVPIWTAILAGVFLRERLRAGAWLGIGLSFVGIVLIASGQGGGIRLEPRALCIVLAAMLTAGYVIVHKRFLMGYGALEFICWAFVAGTVELAVVFWPGFAGEVMGAPTPALLEVGYLGVFPGAIAYLTFAYATRRMTASAVTSFMYAAPVIAMGIAWAYLREVPTVLSVVGGVLAIGGVVVVNRWKVEVQKVKGKGAGE